MQKGGYINYIINGNFDSPYVGQTSGIFHDILGWYSSEIKIVYGPSVNSNWRGQICELDGVVNNQLTQDFRNLPL